MNVDENREIPAKFGIRGIPTLMLFKDGQLAATKVGALSKAQLTAFIDQNWPDFPARASARCCTPSPGTTARKPANARISCHNRQTSQCSIGRGPDLFRQASPPQWLPRPYASPCFFPLRQESFHAP
jgi:thiol-disulfide isomerase/thioredoxin